MKEASRLGFDRVVLPVKNAERLKKAAAEINARRQADGTAAIQLIGIKNIAEIQRLF